MAFDVYMIFITAFALFGAFCLIESIVMGIKYGRCSETVTIIKYDNERAVLNTVEYLHNTLYNNKIIIVSDNGDIFAVNNILDKIIKCQINPEYY